MLSACQLASMRRAVAATFDRTALVLTAARTDDGGGGWVDDWDGATSVSVACSVMNDSSPGDVLEGQRQASDQRRVVTLPYGTAVNTANRLSIGGLTYEVLGVLDDQSYPVSVVVKAKRLA